MTMKYLGAPLGALLILTAPMAYAQTSAAAVQSSTAVDNSKSNSVDPTNKTATADDQKNDKMDLMLTRKIRASIIADKSLSTYAHNVKVVSVNGNVTLNGVVNSEAEKESVGSKAQAAVMHGSVTNDLKVTVPR